MKAIDFHAHVYPEKIAEKAIKNVGDFYSIRIQCDGLADSLVKLSEESGIVTSVIFSPALTAAQVPNINDYIKAECEAHPGRLIGFGTVHADMEKPEEEIARIRTLGLKGIKIHPDTQMFDMDSPAMMQIYEIIQKNNLPVIVHCGDYRYDYSHPKRLANILDTFPKLTVIAAHFGGWSIFDLALEYLKDRFCYLDISSSMEFLGNVRTRELIELYTPKRILFGSDYPMWNPGKELERYLSIGFDKAENEMVLYKNAEEILGFQL